MLKLVTVDEMTHLRCNKPLNDLFRLVAPTQSYFNDLFRLVAPTQSYFNDLFRLVAPTQSYFNDLLTPDMCTKAFGIECMLT